MSQSKRKHNSAAPFAQNLLQYTTIHKKETREDKEDKEEDRDITLAIVMSSRVVAQVSSRRGGRFLSSLLFSSSSDTPHARTFPDASLLWGQMHHRSSSSMFVVDDDVVVKGRATSKKMFFTTCARARAAAAGGEEEEGGETSSSSSSSESEDVGEKNDNNTSKSNKRLTRKDKGSYAGMLTEIDSYESHEFRRTNLYDTREHVGLEENREKVLNELLERVEEITSSEEYKAALAKEMAEMEEEEKNGTERILEWETNLVLEAGGTQDHGLNKKVSLKVNVDALMKETGLSEEAMDYIKAICGKRFLKKTNEIRIVCRRYADREHNRQWCLRALYELIEEGQKEFPSGGFKREDIIELNAKRRNELGDSATYVSQN